LTESIHTMLAQAAAAGPVIDAKVACSVMQGLALENPEEWAVLRDHIVLDAITVAVRQATRRAIARSDPNQAWLPFTQFEHIPRMLEVKACSSGWRICLCRNTGKAGWRSKSGSKGYQLLRRSAEKVSRDKEVVKEMVRLERTLLLTSKVTQI
ncbi:MAG: hypothetical protein M3Z09_08690, partial [Acidobacteriota bacterium]|nr:hypothetical protein [Acidobacteriota bacterium]